MSRRRFLALSSVAALAPGRSFALPHGLGRVYVGTNTGGAGNGILTATWDAQSGTLGSLELAAEIPNPTFLAQYRQGRETRIYAVSELDGDAAMVSAWTTMPGTATLKPLNRVRTGGNSPTHVSVSPDGRTVLVANYGGGSVSSFHVAADGSLSQVVSHVQFSGSGPYPGRQEAPHTHSAVTSPDGRFVLVNDLGLDRIFVFRLDAATSSLVPAAIPFWQARAGSGPRHLAWSPDGRFVYCSNELDSTVETLRWTEHPPMLQAIDHASTLPAGFEPRTAFVGEVLASADGRNVYAGNRVAADTIAVFDTDRSTGRLVQVQLAPSGGLNTRHLALDPSGRWMIAVHQKSNDLTVLARDTATGKLSLTGRSVPASVPMCVLFLR